MFHKHSTITVSIQDTGLSTQNAVLSIQNVGLSTQIIGLSAQDTNLSAQNVGWLLTIWLVVFSMVNNPQASIHKPL